MAQLAAQDVLHTYRRTFLRGLGTVLPTLLTLWIVFAASDFVARTIAGPIADGLKSVLVGTEPGNRVTFYVWESLAFLRQPDPQPVPAGLSEAEEARFLRADRERIEAAEPARRADLRAEIDRRFPKWVGVVLAVIAVFIVGFIMASFIGASLWNLFESWATRIPLVKNIYPGAKQMVNFFLSSDDKTSFQAVVAVEFPRTGLWSIGFLTSDDIPEVRSQAGERVRGVYLGTPAAGQVVLARESEIIGIDMTVDEALKFLMSGGVIGRDPLRPATVPLLPWQGGQAPGPAPGSAPRVD